MATPQITSLTESGLGVAMSFSSDGKTWPRGVRLYIRTVDGGVAMAPGKGHSISKRLPFSSPSLNA